MTTPRLFLRSLFDAAVAAADPALCVPAALPPRPPGRVVVVGAGKASAAMAAAVEAAWPAPLEGLIITRYGLRADSGARLENILIPDRHGAAPRP